MKVREMTPKSFGKKGQILIDYLRSPAYPKDITDGKGICLSGDPTIRSDLFALMAKPAAFEGRRVYLVSLHQLVSVLEHNSERRDQYAGAEFLFVDWFEREFRDDVSPYTFGQLCDVEDFLASRLKRSAITHFTACRRWPDLRWWSKDFIGMMQPHVIDIVL